MICTSPLPITLLNVAAAALTQRNAEHKPLTSPSASQMTHQTPAAGGQHRMLDTLLLAERAMSSLRIYSPASACRAPPSGRTISNRSECMCSKANEVPSMPSRMCYCLQIVFQPIVSIARSSEKSTPPPMTALHLWTLLWPPQVLHPAVTAAGGGSGTANRDGTKRGDADTRPGRPGMLQNCAHPGRIICSSFWRGSIQLTALSATDALDAGDPALWGGPAELTMGSTCSSAGDLSADDNASDLSTYFTSEAELAMQQMQCSVLIHVWHYSHSCCDTSSFCSKSSFWPRGSRLSTKRAQAFGPRAGALVNQQPLL
jgi:hypothetical protein